MAALWRKAREKEMAAHLKEVAEGAPFPKAALEVAPFPEVAPQVAPLPEAAPSGKSSADKNGESGECGRKTGK